MKIQVARPVLDDVIDPVWGQNVADNMNGFTVTRLDRTTDTNAIVTLTKAQWAPGLSAPTLFVASVFSTGNFVTVLGQSLDAGLNLTLQIGLNEPGTGNYLPLRSGAVALVILAQ